MSLPYCKKGDKLVCSVCGKKFIASDNTKYIINGGYVCEWNCFLSVIKEREKKAKLEAKVLKKLENKQEKCENNIEIENIISEDSTVVVKKRGRPKKNKLDEVVIPVKKKRGRPKK